MRLPLALAVLLATPPARAAPPPPVSLEQFIAQPKPAPSHVVPYGDAEVQAVDVFLPRGKGPHPVAVLIHGGCWSRHEGTREALRPVAAELARRGVAVWSIGYRRADEPGGAFPGLFQDVARAVDLLPERAKDYGLDTTRVVVVGHSAGAHLALWAASRARLPASSPLHVARPFVPRQVVALAGLGDLQAMEHAVAQICGPEVLPGLVGAPGPQRPDVYADTSPARLLPSGARVVMVTGTVDRATPPALAQAHVKAARAVGDTAQVVEVAGAGHFDVVTAGTPAWREARARILAAVTRSGRQAPARPTR